jgi:hypothetical protein
MGLAKPPAQRGANVPQRERSGQVLSLWVRIGAPAPSQCDQQDGSSRL